MAGLAIPRGAFEKGIRVTFLAGQIAMPAGQLEAGREMVELRALLGCESCRRKSKCEQECQKRGERAHRVRLTPTRPLEGEGAMTFLALTAVLAQMYVIL